MLKTPFYNYEYGDLQFYYKMHVARQKAQGEIPLAYDTFIKRLKKMTLYDAIYKPRAFEQLAKANEDTKKGNGKRQKAKI